MRAAAVNSFTRELGHLLLLNKSFEIPILQILLVKLKYLHYRNHNVISVFEIVKKHVRKMMVEISIYLSIYREIDHR